MTNRMKSCLKAWIKNQDGQILPWMAMLTVMFLGMAGLTLDLGHAYVSYRELQASTDAAALAGAFELSNPAATTASVQAAVQNASSVTGGKNVNINLPSAKISETPLCLASVTADGVPCNAGALPYNSIRVTQTAVVPTMFIRALAAFGINSASSITESATSTAGMKGATNQQYNIAIVVDTTGSMGSNDNDPTCNNTRIHCALGGIQELLGLLSPCTTASTKTNCIPFDQVGLFTFPNIQANTAKNDYTCPMKNPTVLDYYTPPIPTSGTTTWTPPTGTAATYQVTDYSSNYSSTNQPGGALNASSYLAIAAGASGSKNCNGLQTPGGAETFFAGAVYAAQTSLLAAQAANPGSANSIIVLSDGDANSSQITGAKHAGNTYPSLDDECHQAISAAQLATSQGTKVITIAYGAANSGCSTDKGSLAISPCNTLKQMASTPGDFYSDTGASQNKGQCPSQNSDFTSLKQIFQAITNTYTNARLIPNNAT